jgi:hypothetical protein
VAINRKQRRRLWLRKMLILTMAAVTTLLDQS